MKQNGLEQLANIFLVNAYSCYLYNTKDNKLLEKCYLFLNSIKYEN